MLYILMVYSSLSNLSRILIFDLLPSAILLVGIIISAFDKIRTSEYFALIWISIGMLILAFLI